MKKIMTYAIALIMAFTIIPPGVAAAAVGTDNVVNNPRVSYVGGTEWDCIYFGEYPQSSDGNGGYVTEPIKWRVLSVDGNEALLVSDRILDAKTYMDISPDMDGNEGEGFEIDPESYWTDSTLRKWLNGYSGNDDNFIDTAFTKEQQGSILAKKISDDRIVDDEEFEYEVFSDPLYYTEDKVFCLAFSDVLDNETLGFTHETTAAMTEFAASKGLNDDSWWLRSHYYGRGIYIDYNDGITYRYSAGSKGVRPAIYINLATADWEYAGIATAAAKNKNTDIELQDPRITADGKVEWDCIYFGGYPMYSGKINNDTSSLKWRVLSVDDGKALLISDKIIDQLPFDYDSKTKIKATCWADSYLRAYLNSSFLDNNFTQAEQDSIISRKITNKDNPEFETDSGPSTKDKVYLLSIDEVMNDDYGFRQSYNAADSRKTLALDIPIAQRDAKDDPELTEYWWLRTMGEDSKQAAYVTGGGLISISGYPATQNYYTLGLRPVLNLDLNSDVWSYAGTVSANAIYTPANLKVTASGTNSVSLKWLKVRHANGYKVYRYNSSKGKYVLVKTIEGKDTTSCTIKNLTAGSGYKFRVRAYMGSRLGNNTAAVSAVTNPLKVTINKPTTGKTHYVKVTWKKRTCTGYEVKLATNSKFTKGVKNYKVKSSKTLSKKFTGLKKGKRYYVKVRAYKTSNGITKYGSWSSWKSVYCK